MTDSNATDTRNIIVDFPDFPDDTVVFRLRTFFAAAGTEGFPKKAYILTLSATGQGTQALPVGSGAWVWDVLTPDGENYRGLTLAAGTDLQLTTWLAAALSSETPASLEDSFVLKTGDTMTGLLTLSGAPTVDLHAATKKYVDDNAGGAGGMAAATYDPAAIEEQLVGLTAAQTLTNKTIDDFSNNVDADDLHIQIRNDSGGDLTAGTPVYISGYNVGQDLPTVAKADASGASTMPCIAVISAATISNNSNGSAIVSGRVKDINTSSFSVGDELYVSETPGTFTTTAPTGAALAQKVAVVLRSHASLGIIEVFGTGSTGAADLAAHEADTTAIHGISDTSNLLYLSDINSAVQAYDAGLEDIAALSPADGVIPVGDGANWVAESGATARTSLGAAAAADLTTHTGLTVTAHGGVLPQDTLILSKTATYEVAAADAGKTIECSGTFTVTFPNGLDSGFQVTIVNVGSGTITLSAATTLQGEGTQLATQYTGAVVYHRGSNVWLAMGKLT